MMKQNVKYILTESCRHNENCLQENLALSLASFGSNHLLKMRSIALYHHPTALSKAAVQVGAIPICTFRRITSLILNQRGAMYISA